MRRKRQGDSLRQTSATDPTAIVDNMPDAFPKEEWLVYYWSVSPEGDLVDARAKLHLPRGAMDATRRVRIGQQGLIDNVRRWGVALRGGLLEEMNFDHTPLMSHDRSRFLTEDNEALHLIFQLTHFDLPGHFIIASDEHPFLLFDPGGVLKGSYTKWYTYAGALAFMVTDGNLQTSFGLIWQKDRELYQRVLDKLQEMLKDKRSGETDEG